MTKKRSEAGHIYKELKTRLLELFGPRTEDAYEEAAGLTLTGKPSALAKRLIVLLCDKPKPLDGCCCAKVVTALWKKQLPAVVRANIAGMNMATQMEAMLRKADDVFCSQGQGATARAVAAVDLDETQPALQQVAVVNKKKQSAGDNKNRGTPHPDGPPETACYNHWRFGKSAFNCKRKSTCPWRNFVKPKDNKKD